MTGSKSLQVILILAALIGWNDARYILVGTGKVNETATHEIFKSFRNRKGIMVSVKVRTYKVF